MEFLVGLFMTLLGMFVSLPLCYILVETLGVMLRPSGVCYSLVLYHFTSPFPCPYIQEISWRKQLMELGITIIIAELPLSSPSYLA